MGELRADLKALGYELVETHISWVFLDDAHVFKVKRPVALGFLDFTTAEKRLEACNAEVRLNARLAPDVYLGVVPVTRGPDGYHTLDGKGAVVDWAVHMRRLSDDDRADVRLAEGALSNHDVDRLAALVAAFHEGARCDAETSRHGAVQVIEGNVRENFDQTRDTIKDYLSAEQARAVETWQMQALSHGSRFEARVDAGRVRDGHGDLRLEHVYFGPGESIAIIDCIEFNDRFRYADVCADIAFLSMDLMWQGRVDLAERLLCQYARETDDYDLYSVIDFYESYRAYVRGKVSDLLANDAHASPEARDRARREARRYFLLSLAFDRPALVPPRVIAVGGMIASGKSTVAAFVGDLLAAPVLGSDRTRKRLAGKEPTESLRSKAWSDAYSPAATQRVYAELMRRCEVVGASGRSVVVDASFRTSALRREIRQIATRIGVPFLFVECIAPRDLILERLSRRNHAGAHESDARAELLNDFEARYEPVTELAAHEHIRIDTSLSVEESRQRIERALGSQSADATRDPE